jgi:hypothetical protein
MKGKRILIIWLVKIIIVSISIMVTTKINLSLVATLIIGLDGMIMIMNGKKEYIEWIHVAYVFMLAVNSIFELNGEYRFTIVISQLVLFLAYFVIANIEMQEIEEK